MAKPSKKVRKRSEGAPVAGETWWARVSVPFATEAEADQVIVLPEGDARKCLQWLAAMPCTTLTDAVNAAPDLAGELAEIAEDMEWDGDEFRFAEVPGFADGDLPPPPWRIMHESLPLPLFEQFGRTEVTALNGDFAYLRGADAEAIVAWLAARGYAIVEHPELADLCADPSDFLP